MKRILAVAVAMLLSASFALASGGTEVTSDVSQGQEQGQKQVQGINQDFSSHGNNINGNFPFVPGLPGMYPPNYFPGYERQVNDLASKYIALGIRRVTTEGFEQFRKRLIEKRGEEFWNALKRSVILRPAIPFPKGFSSKEVYILSSLEGYDVNRLEPIGIMAADTRLEKEGAYELLAYRQEIQLFCAVDVMQDGVNIMVPVDAFRAYITPSGTTTGAGVSVGFLRAVSNLFGITGTIQHETMQQKTVMRGDAATSYILFYVADAKKFLNPPKSAPPPQVAPPAEPKKPTCNPEKIQKEINRLEEKVCPNLNRENFDRHLKLYKLDIEMFACTRDETYLHDKYTVEETNQERRGAIGHLQRMEDNLYPENKKTGKRAINPKIAGNERTEALAEMQKAYTDWAGVIYVLFGPTAADNFVCAKNKNTLFNAKIEWIPKGFAP